MKMTIKEAAILMGISQQMLRILIQNNKFDKEIAFCQKNKDRYFYYINRENFIKYIAP